MQGYRNEPKEEYGEILSSLQTPLSEAEEEFTTANIRMRLVVESKEYEDIEGLSTEEINWGLDYLDREGLLEPENNVDTSVLVKQSRTWHKENYSDERLEEVIEELEY